MASIIRMTITVTSNCTLSPLSPTVSTVRMSETRGNMSHTTELRSLSSINATKGKRTTHKCDMEGNKEEVRCACALE